MHLLSEEYRAKRPARSTAWRLLSSAGLLVLVGLLASRIRYETFSAGEAVPPELRVNPLIDFLVWVPASVGVAIIASWLVWVTIYARVRLSDGPHAYYLSGLIFASIMLAVGMIVG